jgi:transcriptional regulator with XRE-family HTH domain
MEHAQLPNRRLRLQRRLRGWSQDDVAAGLCRVAGGRGERDLGVDATMVSRWERGARHPRPRYVRLLCQLFDLPAEQLGLVPDVDLDGMDLAAGDDRRRAAFIREMTSLLGVAPIPPAGCPGAPGLAPAPTEGWERLEAALDRPGRVDEETVAHLERMTLALESLEPTAVSSQLLGPATGHLNAVSALLQASQPAALRARLSSVAGEAAGLVGWLRWNLDDAEGATACFRAGLRAAREAHDRALGAYLVGALACRLPARQDPAGSLRLLTERTGGFVQAEASPATRAWLVAKEADLSAQLGRESACMRALERAAAIVECLPPGLAGRPRFTMVDRTWLAGERGASLVKLGRAAEARTVLAPVLEALGPSSERDRLWLTTSLAVAHAELGDPEEACRLALSALAGATRMHLAPIIQLVRAVHDRLDRHRPNPAVEELHDELREAGAGPLALAT